MSHTMLDAKAKLEAGGLYVKQIGRTSLRITLTIEDVGGGLRVSQDASSLIQCGDNWIAVFPGPGNLSYEVPGRPESLVPLIRDVYKHYRRCGGSLKDAFDRSVPDSQSYLVGRYPTADTQHPVPPARRVEVGTDEGLRLRIEWPEPTTASADFESERGTALLWIAGKLVWGMEEGKTLHPVKLRLVDFLTLLSTTWPYLKWEDRYPFGLQPQDPSELWVVAKRYWEMEMLGEERASEVKAEIAEFERRHDLSHDIDGDESFAFVRLFREGNQIWIHSATSTSLRPQNEVLEQLIAVGDAVSSWMESSDQPSDREVVERWHRREDLLPIELARIATGLSTETIRWVASAAPSEDLGLDAPPGNFRLTEILAAARMMIGSLDPEAVRLAISVIAEQPRVNAERLDQFSDDAEGILFNRQLRRPYVEGYLLAAWLRDVLDVSHRQPVDPSGLLELLGVPLKEIEIQDDRLDALACWGPNHGPVVLVNKSGRHSQSLPGRRATLAHELCHLLIDREGALPLAEVLNGRAPWRVEARARAFAAELLLPRKRAEEVSMASPDIASAVEELRTEFGVSREIAIRQIGNASSAHLTPNKAAELERMVSSL